MGQYKQKNWNNFNKWIIGRNWRSCYWIIVQRCWGNRCWDSQRYQFKKYSPQNISIEWLHLANKFNQVHNKLLANSYILTGYGTDHNKFDLMYEKIQLSNLLKMIIFWLPIYLMVITKNKRDNLRKFMRHKVAKYLK